MRRHHRGRLKPWLTVLQALPGQTASVDLDAGPVAVQRLSRQLQPATGLLDRARGRRARQAPSLVALAPLAWSGARPPGGSHRPDPLQVVVVKPRPRRETAVDP